MTSTNSAKRARSHVRLRVLCAIGVLCVAGIFLIAGGAFGIWLGVIEPNGRHGSGGLKTMLMLGTLMMADGIGLLMPQLLVKLSSALVLASAAAYLFCTDANMRENWWICCVLFLPLLLALWLLLLKRSDKDVSMQEMQNGY